MGGAGAREGERWELIIVPIKAVQVMCTMCAGTAARQEKGVLVRDPRAARGRDLGVTNVKWLCVCVCVCVCARAQLCREMDMGVLVMHM